MFKWLPSGQMSKSALVTTVALLMIGAHLAFRAWAVYGGWFYGDDLIFLSDVAQGNSSLAGIFELHDSQFMPVGLAVAWMVGSTGPFNWTLAATTLLIFQSIASLACWWMLRTLFGNRLRILAPLAFYLFVTISMPGLMWWASGLNVIPVQIGSFTAITAHVLYLRTGRKRFAILAALAIGFGLLCYVKAILIPGVLVVITLCYFTKGPLPKRLLGALRTFWLAWLLYGGICAGFLGFYVSAREESGSTRTPDYLSTFYDLVVSGLSTSILGGPWNWGWYGPGMGPRYTVEPPQLAILLSVLTIILGIGYLASQYRGAMKPLWFVVPYVGATYAVVVGYRAGDFGPLVSRDIRYWIDFLPFAALAIGLACMPLLNSSDPLMRRRVPLITVDPPRWMFAVFGAAFLVGSAYSTITYVEPWHDRFATRQFIENARSGFAESKAPILLANEVVPEAVLPPYSYPYNQLSQFLAPIDADFDVTETATDIKMLDPMGAVTTGRVEGGISVTPDRFDDCLEGGPEPATIRLGSKTFDFPFWLSITYRADKDGALVMVAGDNWRRGPIAEGKHSLFLHTEGAYDRLKIQLEPEMSLCITEIRIGPSIVPNS